MLRIPQTSPWKAGALYLAVRVVLAFFSPVPGAVPLDPLILFVAAGTPPYRFRGAALLPGLLAGDFLAGLPLSLIAVRAAGLMWFLCTEPDTGFHPRFAHHTAWFALWSALPPAWLTMYPASYLFVIHLLQSLLWWGIAAPPLSKMPIRSILPMAGISVVVLALLLLHSEPSLWPVPSLGTTSPLATKLILSGLATAPFILSAIRYKRKAPESAITI